MKTTINRRDLYNIERLMWKLVKPSELPKTVSCVSGSDGLTFSALCCNAVLSISVPSDDEVEAFSLPWSVVKEFAARKNDYLDIELNGSNITLSWSVKGVPQTRTIQSLDVNTELPPLPDKTTAHSLPKLFDAMLNAGRCVDADNKRYSLGGICFRGEKSQILSTDGRQALVQENFEFPFENDVLCPVSKFFRSKELRECGDSVALGATEDWVYFQHNRPEVGCLPIFVSLFISKTFYKGELKCLSN